MDLITIGDNDDDEEVYDPESAFAEDSATAGTLPKQPAKKKIRVEILDNAPAAPKPKQQQPPLASADDPQFSDDESGKYSQKKALLHSVVGTISSFTLTAFRLISSGRPRTHTLQGPRWLHRRACQAYETDRAGKGPDQVSGRIEPRPRTRLQGFAQRHC